jgi:hypothetical protein
MSMCKDCPFRKSNKNFLNLENTNIDLEEIIDQNLKQMCHEKHIDFDTNKPKIVLQTELSPLISDNNICKGFIKSLMKNKLYPDWLANKINDGIIENKFVEENEDICNFHEAYKL